MISEDDGRNTLEFDDHYVVQPQFHWWADDYGAQKGGRAVPEGFRYSSDANDRWLTESELLEMIQPFMGD
jgi:UDP-N-acetylglucosamine 4,6-dehydratase